MLFLTLEQLSVPEALGISLVGILIGFCALSLLIPIIRLISLMAAKLQKPVKDEIQVLPVAALPQMTPAKGSFGDVKLYDVDEKTAALLIAIVADEIGAPLNELRFISIREKLEKKYSEIDEKFESIASSAIGGEKMGR